MRVLVIADMYGTGGAGHSLHRQALALGDRGVELTVIRPRARLGKGSVARRERAAAIHGSMDGISLSDAAYWNLPVWLAPGLTAAACSRSVKRHAVIGEPSRFDLIHAHRLYPNGLAALDLGRERGLPVVVSARGSEVHTHPHTMPGFKRLVRRTIEEADAVLAVSEDLACQIADLAEPRRPVRVVYNGVDAESFSPSEDRTIERAALGLPREGVGICFVGRLVSAKGLEALFTAFERIEARTRNWWAVVVGAGAMAPMLSDWAAASGLRVLFPGAVPNERVATFLRASDLFVLPSHGEGLPNAVLEAMATGLAVVATEVGGIPEAVRDGESGILVPRGNPAALARALQTLIEDPERRSLLGSRAREIALDRFSWAQSASSLETVYREIIG